MPTTHVSKVFAVKDARIARLTADVVGSAPTYAASVDVPGIKSVTISGDITTAELRGDNQRLDFNALLSGISVEFEHAKLSLDALNVLTGSAITDTAETAAGAGDSTARLGINSNDKFNYFRFQAVSAGADPLAGDVLFTLHKVILSEFPDLGMAEEDYQTFTVSGAALPIVGTPAGAWVDVTIRDKTAALA